MCTQAASDARPVPGVHMTFSVSFDGEELAITPRQIGDDKSAEAFVLNAWLTSYRIGSEPRLMGNDVYFRSHHKVASALVDRATVLIATPANEPSLFLGFVCAEPDTRIVHYVFVKKGWRELGIARGLVRAMADSWPADSEIAFTHHTYFVEHVRKRSAECRRRLVYNPYRRSAA